MERAKGGAAGRPRTRKRALEGSEPEQTTKKREKATTKASNVSVETQNKNENTEEPVFLDALEEKPEDLDENVGASQSDVAVAETDTSPTKTSADKPQTSAPDVTKEKSKAPEAQAKPPTRVTTPRHIGRDQTAERERIKELLAATDFEYVGLFSFLKSVAMGDISPIVAADALRTKYVHVARDSAIVLRILDIVSFLLETTEFQENLELFIESMERFGITTSREIIATIDANKLDSCGYSNGLAVISRRERTRNFYVLKVHSLWREASSGYDLLYKFLYFHTQTVIPRGDTDLTHIESDSKGNEEAESVLKREIDEQSSAMHSSDPADESTEIKRADGKYVSTNFGDIYCKRISDDISRIAGKYNLCPTRVLYEVFTWCCLKCEDLSMAYRLLKEYPNGKLEDVIKLLLRSFIHSYDQADVDKYRHYMDKTGLLYSNIYLVIAYLVAMGKVSMDKIYGHLDIKDEYFTEISEHFYKTCDKRPVNTNRSILGVPVLYCIANSLFRENVTISETSRYVQRLYRAQRSRNTIRSANQDSNEVPSLKMTIHRVTMDKSSVYTARSMIHKHYLESSGGDPLVHSIVSSDNFFYVRDSIFAMDSAKIRILSSLIDVCDEFSGSAWKAAEMAILHFYKLKTPVFLFGLVCKSLSGVIRRYLSNYLKSPELMNQEENDELHKQAMETVEKYLLLVGPNMFFDPIAFSLVLSFLNRSLQENREKVINMLWNSILPALSLCTEGNSQIGDRVWRIFSKLGASERYHVYSKYCVTYLGSKITESDNFQTLYKSFSIALVSTCHAVQCTRTRSIFKRVTANLLKSSKSASVRAIVSLVTGIASVNPFSVVDTIISQCEMFENLVAPLSELSKYFSKLTCDVFFYKLSCNMYNVSNIDRGVDEIGRSKKLVVNAQLSARLFRRHTDVDIVPLVTNVILFLMKTLEMDTLSLKKEQSSHEQEDAKVLKLDTPGGTYPDKLSNAWTALEYLSALLEISGVPQLAETHSLTIDQLNAQAGGPLLKMEIMAQGPDDEISSTNIRESLGKTILRPFFVHSVLLLSGKLRTEVLYDSEFADGIRSMCGIADHLQRTCLQLVEYIHSVVSVNPNYLELYQNLVPPVEELTRFWDTATALSFSINPRSNHMETKEKEILDGEDVAPLSPKFFKLVRSLRLHDVYVPQEQYERCIQRLEDWINDTTNNTHRKVKKLHSRRASLRAEYESHISHNSSIHQLLAAHSEDWLVDNVSVGPTITTKFVTQCISKRILISESDALFCSRIVDVMIELKYRYFNYFDFTNCWTKMLMPLVRSCTEREAPLLAIFVSHHFRNIKAWIADKELFKSVVDKHPAFCTTFQYNPEKALTHEQLLCGIRKWEGRVLRALSHPLQLSLHKSGQVDTGRTESPRNSDVSTVSDESVDIPDCTWIDVKGAIVFLARCHETFPITAPAGKRVLNCLKNVVQNAQRNGWKDVVVCANTLLKTMEKYDREHKWL
ncbi:conserved hypothetical protein [Theileria equi strain WA]|uniref:THO complex subunit 2 n=1 Tax=Theileria equi strain WA TaxID=1537102 RepID=L1LE05_THEEQ|nr:conserved hypothetical protein [Theileria equi strain WA]EKX73480.1 conserved hypothetical protein [Theileria equi strain WA]|eukprot:XP_004832932.1 conserved hypothetical protein [Theileria equi strain WA]